MRIRLSVALPLWLARREGMTSQSGWVRHCSPAPLNTLLPRVKCLTRLFGPLLTMPPLWRYGDQQIQLPLLPSKLKPMRDVVFMVWGAVAWKGHHRSQSVMWSCDALVSEWRTLPWWKFLPTPPLPLPPPCSRNFLQRIELNIQTGSANACPYNKQAGPILMGFSGLWRRGVRTCLCVTQEEAWNFSRPLDLCYMEYTAGDRETVFSRRFCFDLQQLAVNYWVRGLRGVLY